ncbi:MAG: hypothetical protein HRT47_06640 [Candidatus Caenarcaniphilales bacterium]|nr:hypothetical protein [Candidatus Caenarcaniphilales bacterium]
METPNPSSILDPNYEPPDGSDLPNLEYLPEYKDTKNTAKINHSVDYCSAKSDYSQKQYFRKGIDREEDQEMIVYTKPGQARAIELVTGDDDPRAGELPQHNTQGEFDPNIPIPPTRDITDIQKDFYQRYLFKQYGYHQVTAVMTQKKLITLHSQFYNLKLMAFRHMLGIEEKERDKRDFEVWVKELGEKEHAFLVADPLMGFANFMQIVKKNDEGIPKNVIFIPFHEGNAVVMAESYIDDDGRLRNIAHIGIAGAAAVNNTKTDRRSGLERFDDGTIMWTVTSYKKGRSTTGAAALRPDGTIVLMKNSQNKKLAQAAARSLGGEGINPQNKVWNGKFSIDGCLPFDKDPHELRTDYKKAVLKQTSALIDGSCIPGILPIFDPKLD